MYQTYKNQGLTVIVLISENYDYQTPSQSDLMDWANTYGITHPVVVDAGFNETVQYLWANPEFTGTIGLPNMQLLSSGMVVELSNSWPSDSYIVSFLP